MQDLIIDLAVFSECLLPRCALPAGPLKLKPSPFPDPVFEQIKLDDVRCSESGVARL